MKSYCELSAWRAKHIPWLLLPDGAEIFFRLTSSQTRQPIHTSDFYGIAGVSPSTIRSTLDEMHRKGLITITPDPQDKRRHIVVAAPLLFRKASFYAKAMYRLLL